jgi:hypothetical protein
MLHTADIQSWRRTPGLLRLQLAIPGYQITTQGRQLVQQVLTIRLP